jgi:hypothetical protein
VTARTPGKFSTKILTKGVDPQVSCTYKLCRIKQYFKEGRALRTETVIADTRDFGIGRRVCADNWRALRSVGENANRLALRDSRDPAGGGGVRCGGRGRRRAPIPRRRYGSGMTGVYLEAGAKRVIACAVDWPGWCRSGRGEEQALEMLAAYRERYAPVAKRAGLDLPDDEFEVVERLATRGGAADFGVPGAIAAGDVLEVTAKDAGRLAALVEAAWAVLDDVYASSPAELRKGPRGGGRDRDKMYDHVVGAEATGYSRKLGLRLKQPALDDREAILAARAEIVAVLSRPSGGGPLAEKGWPVRYAARRVAWHALDHAWEMEDRRV